MDTDELSKEAYKAILGETEKFNHDLTLQFGLLSYSCSDEEECLSNAEKLILEIQGLDNADLSGMFFGTLPNKTKLKKTLEKILRNIDEVKLIDKRQRHYDF